MNRQRIRQHISFTMCLLMMVAAVVMRPYCRFVCPTGTLMKMAEDVK